MNKEQITEIVKKENVKFIKLMFVDIDGKPKVIEVASTSLPSILDNKILVDGSSITGLSTIDRSDLILAPDLSSFRRLSIYDAPIGNVAMFMCDILTVKEEAMPGCTRTNLRNQLDKMKKLGFDKMNVGFEPEFFLFSKPPVGKIDESFFCDTAGYTDSEETDTRAHVRREIMHELGKIGIQCITSHHEVSPSQHEISYLFADALTACDNLVLFRIIVTEVARKHGLYASFMPKPVEGINGNGLHTHISLEKGSANAFAGNGDLADTAKHFITGILTHARPLCMLTNPDPNSYRRLVPCFEAPTNICWGYANRSAMIRIPNASGKATRIEVRNPDSCSNPYLAVSGLLAAGLDGIAKKLPIIANVDFNVFVEKTKQIASLCGCLDESIAEFERSEVIRAALTDHIATILVKEKSKLTDVR